MLGRLIAVTLLLWAGWLEAAGVAIVRSPITQAGGGTETYVPAGMIEVNTTSAATAANTTETDLWTYALPANTLNANGRAVRVTVWGTTGATANTKTMRIYFGATVVATVTGAGNAAPWRLTATVIRTGASAQVALGTISQLAVTGMTPTSVAPVADTTGAITIKLSGQNSSAVASDIVFTGAIVEVLP